MRRTTPSRTLSKPQPKIRSETIPSSRHRRANAVFCWHAECFLYLVYGFAGACAAKTALGRRSVRRAERGRAERDAWIARLAKVFWRARDRADLCSQPRRAERLERV